MKILSLLFLLSVSLSGTSQPVVKIYAWSQVRIPGNIPKDDMTDENENPVKLNNQHPVIYHIFVVYSPSSAITPCELWIKGRYYKIQTNKIDSTPVTTINYNIPGSPVTEVLVPATKLAVAAIVPIEEKKDVSIRTPSVKNMIEQSELVAGYYYKGKEYFIAIEKAKELQPFAGL